MIKVFVTLTGIVLLLGCLHLSEHTELHTSNLFAIKWTNYISNKTDSCKTVSLYMFCTQNDKPHRFPSRKSLLPSCGGYISQPLATKSMPEGCDLTNILAFLKQPAFPDWTERKNKGPIILAWPGPHLTPLFPPTTHTHCYTHSPNGVGHHSDNCDASSSQFLLLLFAGVDLWHISYTLNSISLSTFREINLW